LQIGTAITSAPRTFTPVMVLIYCFLFFKFGGLAGQREE